MKRLQALLLSVALALSPFAAYAADEAPAQAFISASSGNVAAAQAQASLAAQKGYVNYVCGISLTSSGSTSGLAVSPTLSGVQGGTMTFTYTSLAGVAVANAPLNVQFTPCLPATDNNVAITLTMPSLGGGNTNATAVLWGYRKAFP